MDRCLSQVVDISAPAGAVKPADSPQGNTLTPWVKWFDEIVHHFAGETEIGIQDLWLYRGALGALIPAKGG